MSTPPEYGISSDNTADRDSRVSDFTSNTHSSRASDLQPGDDLGEQDPEGEDVDLGPGRIAASETEAANMLAKLV